MRTNKTFDFAISLAALYFLSSILIPAYAQPQENGNENTGTIKVIEKALQNYDTKKQNEEETFKVHLNSLLGQATKAWIANMEKTRYSQLDNVIGQDWDKQPRTAMILPFDYNYYLRGYEYSVSNSDIIKTESISPVYKGIVVVKEILYAEKSHHSNVSDIKQYLYTVTNLCTLNFIYMDDKFELINTDTRMESKINEMSNEARKEWLWQRL
ncbi:MAG: hypothetical protein PHT50_04495 [Candidatus Omnitrophica bacterium]|nr:hypothetical protein [Candidatus Omnitrophota bacterium]